MPSADRRQIVRTSIYRIPILCAAFFCVAGMSCHAMWQREPDLTDAAVLMYEYPDSAMTVVERLEPRFSIVDTASARQVDSVTHSVFNYYRKHKSRTEKLDMYYILGRFHQIRGNEESAMSCYVNAEQYVGDAADAVLPGCLSASMASLYEYGYDYAKAVDGYMTAGRHFKEAGDYRHFARVNIRAARCCFYMGDELRAMAILDDMAPYMESVEDADQVRYFRLILNMNHEIPLDDVINAVEHLDLRGDTSPDQGYLLAISDIYLKSGYTDSAMVYIDRYREATPAFSSNPTYYLRLSNVYDTLGLEKMALQAYKKHVALKDSTYLDKIDENVQMVAAMYDNYVQMSRSEREKRLLLYSIAAILVVGAGVVLHFRRKIWKQSRRADYLEELYRNVSKEKDALTAIRKNSVLIDEPSRNVIENRLAALDEILTMRRLGNYSPKRALEMIESIALDQEAYMNSLGLMFSLRHPALSDYLRSRQFSTWEIGYCSLYSMGFKGKDIGNILGSSRYYKINSVIRKKLGLAPTETNLDIYLRKLIADIEPRSDGSAADGR